jgi:sulfite exporter TauE/SafE
VAIVLAVALLAFAVGLDKHLGRIPGAGRIVTATIGHTKGLPAGQRATVLGFLTPLLPCGLLYAAVTAAAVSGSTLGGGASMLGFALGLLPLLAFTQLNLGWLHARLGRDRVRWLARIAMTVAAAMLLWRGIGELTSHAESPSCPLCEQEGG